MKKFLYVLIASTLLIACAPSKKNYLYSWGQYYDASYGYLKNKDDKSTQALVDNYKSIQVSGEKCLQGYMRTMVFC